MTVNLLAIFRAPDSAERGEGCAIIISRLHRLPTFARRWRSVPEHSKRRKGSLAYDPFGMGLLLRRVYSLGSCGRQKDLGLQLSRCEGSHCSGRQRRTEARGGRCEARSGQAPLRRLGIWCRHMVTSAYPLAQKSQSSAARPRVGSLHRLPTFARRWRSVPEHSKRRKGSLAYDPFGMGLGARESACGSEESLGRKSLSGQRITGQSFPPSPQPNHPHWWWTWPLGLRREC